MLEADSKIRQDERMAMDAETIGLFSPRMSIKPLKPVNEAYPNKKLNNASEPMDQTSCLRMPSAWLKCFLGNSRTQYLLF